MGKNKILFSIILGIFIITFLIFILNPSKFNITGSTISEGFENKSIKQSGEQIEESQDELEESIEQEETKEPGPEESTKLDSSFNESSEPEVDEQDLNETIIESVNETFADNDTIVENETLPESNLTNITEKL